MTAEEQQQTMLANEADTVEQLIKLLSSFAPERKLLYGWSENGDRRVKVSAASDGAVCLDPGSLIDQSYRMT